MKLKSELEIIKFGVAELKILPSTLNLLVVVSVAIVVDVLDVEELEVLLEVLLLELKDASVVIEVLYLWN